MTLEAGTLLGRYEIRSLLGAGGMGEVYRAFDPKLGREVAIKVLPGQFAAEADRLARFEREARAAGALNHPNVLAIHDVEADGGAPFVVSELLEGQTLRAQLGGGALPLRKALDYAAQIARGLAAAHEKGIVHRDLKPDNLFVTADGRVKILDFGLAKLMEADGDGARTDLPTRRAQTASGEVMGTVGYMSPEQLRGRAVDARTDIFSFGAVLYEMLSGRRAFHGESAADTISAILREDPPEFAATGRQVNPELERIVRRCLEKSREERYHSASDLAFAIESLSGAHTTAAPTASQTSSASQPTLQHATAANAGAATGRLRRLPLERAGWIAAGLLLVSTLALALLYFRRAEPRAETMRFTLPVPDGAIYGDSLALSPDGSRLAFVAIGGAGLPSLWVRALDSVSARELPGTEGAAFPFWSPDGRSLGFFAGNKLKKIDAAGGPAQTVADASSEARGGSWGADGTILFAPTFTSPLYRVPAAGGAAEPATELDEARKLTSHRWPHFLPGGRHFLYFARSPQKEAEGIYVGSLCSKEGKLLLNTNLLAAYAPAATGGEGYVLFMRGRTLVAQPFDAGRLELSGDPVVVAEGVLAFPGEGGPTAYAAFTASANGRLAYLSGNPSQVQMGWYDRSGNLLGTLGQPGTYHEPALSPDGRRIALGRGENDSHDIWLVDAARGTPTRFTFEPAADVSPVWSPDGSRVAFASMRGGKFEIYQKLSNGAGGDELLLKTEHNSFPDSWTPDGRLLIYETEQPQTRFDLYVLPLDGDRQPRAFLNSEFNETHSQLSPDGRFVAYVSDESGRAEVYVRSFPDPGGKWQVSTAGGDQPQWRRDGRELFYIAPDKKLMSVPVRPGASFESDHPAALFATRLPTIGLTDDRNHFFPAPDGQRFLLNSLVEGGDTQPLTLVLNWAAGLKQ
ncbi:MAG TPA: protein kinase [Pyrinomonadaceae bacterium]|nr:protein kinase [Pyrinomonadaceae bacterium]